MVQLNFICCTVSCSIGHLMDIFSLVLVASLAVASLSKIAGRAAFTQTLRSQTSLYSKFTTAVEMLEKVKSFFLNFIDSCRNISSGVYGTFIIFSVKLTLSMQIIGFCVRLSSSLLWIQMYKLGVSYIDCSVSREADNDMRNSFLNPATPITRQPSNSDDALGGSVYDPAYYSSLFEDGKDETYFYRVRSSTLELPVLFFCYPFINN